MLALRRGALSASAAASRCALVSPRGRSSLTESVARRRPQRAPGRRASLQKSRSMAAAAAATTPTMSEEEKFLFDLNGYLHVPGVLSAAEVALCLEGVQRHAADFRERTGAALRNSAPDTPLAGDGVSGRRDLAGMLGWEAPYREPFRQVLAHPRLLPYLHELLGRGYRLDHLPLLIAQTKGTEGFRLHGGPLTEDGAPEHQLAYACRQGRMFNPLLAVAVQLTDVGPQAGGFCVVRGSHKSNFVAPPRMLDLQAHQEHVHQPQTKAGDVILFSESTLHGTLPWRMEEQRLAVLYRFAPNNHAYGRSYLPWPAHFTEGMTEAQLAVMEPPYNTRLDRPCVELDGSVTTASRSAAKKDFDMSVFKTPYF